MRCGTRAHLTQRAATIFMQLRHGEPYDIADPTIEWGGIDPQVCVNEFIRRELAQKLD